MNRPAIPPSHPPADDPHPSGTRAILADLSDDPDVGWAELMPRVEGRLRLVIHYWQAARPAVTIDPDDVLQEVWITAARKLAEFEYRGPGSLQRWMAGILRNKLMHAQRAGRRRPMSESALAHQSADRDSPKADLFAALEKSQPGVSRRAQLQEAVEQVRRVLDRLPPAERDVVVMKVYEGLTGREIAERLGVEESTVSVRFRRALASCARHLRDLAE